MMDKRWGVWVLAFVVVVLLIAGCNSATEKPPPETQAVAVESPVTPSASTSGPKPTSRPTPATTIEDALIHVRRFEGKTVARVNGQEISWRDYEPMLMQSLNTLVQQYEVDWSDAAMQQKLRDFQLDVLKQLVDQVLMRQMADELGISVDEAVLNEQIESTKSRLLESGQYVTWDAFLQENHLTEEFFTDMIRDSLLTSDLLEAQNVAQEEEQVHLRLIEVGDVVTAQAIWEELEAGRDFGEMVAQYGQDDATGDEAGDIGWFTRGAMPAEIEQAAFSLAPGQHSRPIETDTGYAIILVLEREIRELDPTLLRQRQSVALMAQLDATRTEAEIEYLVDFAAN